jgi:hypothetical protein
MNQIVYYFLFGNILRILIINHNDHGQIWVTMEDDVYFNSKDAATLFVF